MSRYVVALTGGIASGKSSVARHFERHGVQVHDADFGARAVVAPGSDGLAAIVEAFGAGVLDAGAALDRAAMRRRVFADPDARHTLEAIVHPRVRAWLHEQIAADRGAYCLAMIPLLAENRAHYRWIDRVLAVDVSEQTQIARLIQRDGIDDALARRMLASQATRAQRLAIADDVLDNTGEPAALEAAVDALHRRYLEFAAARR